MERAGLRLRPRGPLNVLEAWTFERRYTIRRDAGDAGRRVEEQNTAAAQR
jgi:hypothetical protein